MNPSKEIRRACATRVSPIAGFSAAAIVALFAGTAIGQDCDGDGIADALQTFRWNANVASFWGSPNNWQSQSPGIPGATSLAIFDGSNGFGTPPFSVFMDGFTSVRGLSVLDSDTSFDLGGSQFSVTGTLANCREFLLGGELGAKLTISGVGQFDIARGVIGDQPGVAGRLVMDGFNGPMQLRHTSLAPLVVGQAGSGFVDLIEASFVHDGPLIIGSKEGSDGTFTAMGLSTVLLSDEAPSNVIVGFQGDGLLQFAYNSVLSSSSPFSLRIGSGASGTGEVLFIGLAQQQNFSVSFLEIGGLGVGRLGIEQGSNVLMNATSDVALGLSQGSRGDAEILNFSQWTINGAGLDVGPGGRGELGIGEGSDVFINLGTQVFVDGVVKGSGLLAGDIELIGGEIRPTDEYAEFADRQTLQINGNLAFSGLNPATGLVESGRMVYTLISASAQDSMSAVVSGSTSLDGTLRVIVPVGVIPGASVQYPVVESSTMTGTFAGVQSPVLGGNVIALPVYSGAGDVSVKFIKNETPESFLGLSQNLFVEGDIVDAVVTDINGDGFPDLVTLAEKAPGTNGEIRVTLNLGVTAAGGWLGFSQTSALFDSLGDLPKSLTIGDMNGDNLPDLVIMNTGPASRQVRIRLNSQVQPGDFSQVDQRIITVNGTPADIALADISGNGMLDVITVFDRATRGPTDGGVQVSENDGAGFDDSEGDTGDDPGSVDTMGGEYTPSGVAVSSKGTDSMYLYGTGLLNRGTVFPLFLSQKIPVGRDPDSIFTADLTGDGLDDVISSDGKSGTISVLVAQDSGELLYRDAISLNAGSTPFEAVPGSVVAIDVNDDQRLDLVFTARDAMGQVGVRRILNIGQGDSGERLFSDSLPMPESNGNTPRVLAVADLDQDGSDDLVIVRAPMNGPTISSLTVPVPQGCNAADLSTPLGVLDLSDISAFIAGFTGMDPIADLAAPFGVFDLADLGVFTTEFLNGCP